MRLRATVRIRNDEIIAAREARGWSQRQLADYIGHRVDVVGSLEKLDYSRIGVGKLMAVAADIADVLELSADAVLPKDLIGERLETERVLVAVVPNERLIEAAQKLSTSLIGCSQSQVSDSLARADDRDALETYIERAKLTKIQETIIRHRWGIGAPLLTLEEVGTMLGKARERIRQIEAKAFCRIQRASVGIRMQEQPIYVPPAPAGTPSTPKRRKKNKRYWKKM
jgi:transcriptional regulator with XRE-family HTH domain